MPKIKNTLSLIVPIFNEEKSILIFYSEYRKVFKTLAKKELMIELIFVDDESNDRRGNLKNRVSIDQRPHVVEERSRVGDWEADTIIGKVH